MAGSSPAKAMEEVFLLDPSSPWFDPRVSPFLGVLFFSSRRSYGHPEQKAAVLA
jgi:hypothetical protein